MMCQNCNVKPAQKWFNHGSGKLQLSELCLDCQAAFPSAPEHSSDRSNDVTPTAFRPYNATVPGPRPPVDALASARSSFRVTSGLESSFYDQRGSPHNHSLMDKGVAAHDYYHVRPLHYQTISIHKPITWDIDEKWRLRGPGFIDTTAHDMLVVSEFGKEHVFVCNQDLRVVHVFNHYKSCKNLFVVKAYDRILCSDWHRVSLCDIQSGNLVWAVHTHARIDNPWGLCTLEGHQFEVAVCFPSVGHIRIYDIRVSEADSHVRQWSFGNGTAWTSDRVLPYAVAPNGTFVAGMGAGDGCIASCDLRNGLVTEVFPRLDRLLNVERNVCLSSELPACSQINPAMSCRMNDIIQDSHGTVVIPDLAYSRLIIKEADSLHVMSDARVMKAPCSVAVLRNGSLLVSDSSQTSMLMCHM